MGGVAGHAGVFSTADDLARYARDDARRGDCFAPATVALFTSPAVATRSADPARPRLGYRLAVLVQSRRYFPARTSYGHTGFTGPALWIDPASKSFIVIMTNRVHPKGGRSINEWRRKRRHHRCDGSGSRTHESCDADRSRCAGAAKLRIASGRQRRSDHQSDRPRSAGPPQYRCDARRGRERRRALCSRARNHGERGSTRTSPIRATTPRALPVFSLYFNSRFRLTPEMLKGIDTLVFDIQDVGARFLHLRLHDACSRWRRPRRRSVPFYVLDRPNPVTGSHVEGPMLDPESEGITGCYSLPVRHGLTLGELATMGNAERKLERRPARDHDAELGARRLVRFDRSALDRSFAQHAQPECRDALSGPGADRIVEELFGGTGHGCSVRTDRRGLDPRRGTGRVPERPLHSGCARLSHAS